MEAANSSEFKNLQQSTAASTTVRLETSISCLNTLLGLVSNVVQHPTSSLTKNLDSNTFGMVV